MSKLRPTTRMAVVWMVEEVAAFSTRPHQDRLTWHVDPFSRCQLFALLELNPYWFRLFFSLLPLESQKSCFSFTTTLFAAQQHTYTYTYTIYTYTQPYMCARNLFLSSYVFYNLSTCRSYSVATLYGARAHTYNSTRHNHFFARASSRLVCRHRYIQSIGVARYVKQVVVIQCDIAITVVVGLLR